MPYRNVVFRYGIYTFLHSLLQVNGNYWMRHLFSASSIAFRILVDVYLLSAE